MVMHISSAESGGDKDAHSALLVDELLFLFYETNQSVWNLPLLQQG